MSRLDWLVPTDDLLTERPPTCLLCGSRRAGRADIQLVADLAVCVRLCDPCWFRERRQVAVTALLHRRYGAR
jgi:hypothetical protein